MSAPARFRCTSSLPAPTGDLGLASMNAAQPESRFQDPTEWCPHPERWHATDGDSTEQEVTELIAAFARALQPDLVIETGSGFGQTTALLAESLWLNGQGRLVSFETNADRLEQVQDRVAHIPARFWELRNEDVREWVPLGVIEIGRASCRERV